MPKTYIYNKEHEDTHRLTKANGSFLKCARKYLQLILRLACIISLRNKKADRN